MSRPRIMVTPGLGSIERLLTYPPGTWFEIDHQPHRLVRWEADCTLLVLRYNGIKCKHRRYRRVTYTNPNLRVIL